IRVVFMQGVDIPIYWLHRVLFYLWILFWFIVYVLYSGGLIASLSLPAFEPAVQSLSDLLDASREGKIYPLLIQGTATITLLRNAKSGVYKNLWEVADLENNFASNREDGFNKCPPFACGRSCGQVDS
ncbi:unnamed protein product, partial [Meganyctiphanes norvegica]